MNEPDGSITPEITEADDPALAEEIAALVDRLRRGERIEPDDLDGPLGDELRLLLPTIRMMSELAVPEPQDVDLGTLGDFRILREAGRGGMGVVYEAVQVSLGRRVALKVLLNAAAIDPRHVRRFQVEAQAAAGLHHPGIVPVFATGAEDGIRFYAMRFIEGQDLARVIQGWKREPSPTSGSTRDRLRTAAELGRQAAEALAYAHAQEVLHRDIKPSNLLVDRGRSFVDRRLRPGPHPERPGPDPHGRPARHAALHEPGTGPRSRGRPSTSGRTSTRWGPPSTSS